MSDLIPIEKPPAPPRLPGKVAVRPDSDAAIDAIAAELLVMAIQCVRQFGTFHLALSGGSTPLPLYRRLMYDTTYRQLPWDRTHVWMVDDRCVPMDDPRCNYKAIEELIVQHSGMPEAHAHPMPVLEPDGDRQYEAALRAQLSQRPSGHDRLDFVVLGMGNDAHTASLFPHSPALLEPAEASGGAKGAAAPTRWVRFNRGPRVTPPDRLTMTLELLNASRALGVLVLGEGKRDTINKVSSAFVANAATSDMPVLDLPILGVRPKAGDLRWYLDAAACPPSAAS